MANRNKLLLDTTLKGHLLEFLPVCLEESELGTRFHRYNALGVNQMLDGGPRGPRSHGGGSGGKERDSLILNGQIAWKKPDGADLRLSI